MKIKQLVSTIIVLVMFIAMSSPALAYNYTFSSGADSKTTFDKPTQTDEITPQNPYTENIRKNKDAAYNPPPYGIFSGDIPTDPSSPYHTQDKSNAVTTASPAVSYSDYSSGNISEMPPAFNYTDEEMSASTSLYSENANTLPLYYADGSIGTLEFPRFKKTIKVYEGETLDNMRFGAGHASGTSTWDGNCAIFAHNRGVVNNFGFLKDMNVGDKVNYTTKYGQRTYEVISKTQIGDTDMNPLMWSGKNILNLVTCVENVGNMRICVICREVTD